MKPDGMTGVGARQTMADASVRESVTQQAAKSMADEPVGASAQPVEATATQGTAAPTSAPASSATAPASASATAPASAPASPSPAPDTPAEARARALMRGLGYCGHYMHFHAGGRSGQAPILCELNKNGGQLSQQELGMKFELKPGSLSEILSKLESAGLIERTRNPSDRRQLFVRLTRAGRAKAAEDQRARLRFRQLAFDCLTPAEQEQLLDMLGRIRTRWEELDG